MAEEQDDPLTTEELDIENVKSTATRLAYHPPFTEAVTIGWPRRKHGLHYDIEFNLSKEPRRIDMYITKTAHSPNSKSKKPEEITDPIGSFFSKYNIISYKGPGSQFSVASFYEALSYVCEYKSGSTSLSRLPDELFHISAFVDQKPVALFHYMEKQFHWHLDPSLPKGIFRCEYGQFKIQIIVIPQLDPDVYPFLTVLTKRMTDRKWNAFVKRVNSMYALNQAVGDPPGDKSPGF